MTMGCTAVRCPASLVLYFVCTGLLYPILAQEVLEIKHITAKREEGGIGNVTCTATSEKAIIKWLFQEQPFKPDERKKITTTIGEEQLNDLDDNKRKIKTSNIIIANATYSDAGNYTCIASVDDEEVSREITLDLRFEAKFINATESPVRRNVTDNANVTVECIFEVYNLTEVKWYKKGEEGFHIDIPKQINTTHVKSTHLIRIHNAEDNGTYVCELKDPVSLSTKYGTIDLFIYGSPKFKSANATAINTTEIYLNWTVLSYNSDIRYYYLFYRKANDSKGFQQYSDAKIGTKNTSFVMKGLDRATKYEVHLEVGTAHGSGKSSIMIVETLAEEPIFVPNISINGFSATSVTIGWAPPKKEIEQFIHYYLLEARKKDENVSRRAYHSRDRRNLPYMFDNLEPHSTYVFQVCACSDYGVERCGNWSDEMEAATLDGVPSKPSDVRVDCSTSYMNLTWGPPLRPNAEIKGYTMELTGNATYNDRFGKSRFSTWGPLSKFTTNNSRSVRFDDLQPNTHYTVKLSAMTRTRRRGDEETRYCTTKPAPPDQPPRPRWRKILENDRYMFKMYLPRISERNGPICCYRVYMVRLLPNSDWKNLPSPKDIPVVDYKDAHAQTPALRAYITDVFSNERFPAESELVMGDSESYFDRNEPTFKRDACLHCLQIPNRVEPTPTPTPTTTTTTTATSPTTGDDDFMDEDNATLDPLMELEEVAAPPAPVPKERRSIEDNGSFRDYSRDLTMLDKVEDDKELQPADGPLDSNTNYTLFVELITGIPHAPPVFSNYVNVLMPAPTAVAPQPTSAVEIALQATCAIAALVLLLMITFCVRQTRRSRKMPPHAHLELNPLQMAYRYVLGLGGRTQPSRAVPAEMPPIAAEGLPAAYLERQADSDYGFQKEFEYINYLQYNAERVPKTAKLLQMLPECFNDRTTHASEARENQPKNRYPDIKAYDQTRVVLSQIDSINGSDYINANYVRGYQERKQFICAQGPTDTTVNDFWRMIWEHGLELIVMLTNLEEYSKVKCSKYWPDELRGSRAFGNITVHHVSEKRYSDYVVRELRITKQPTTAEGQLIVENNGVAKRNGDCKEAAEGSVPTSPREVKDNESRTVKQYHFLMWKDFAAPEHAYSILKFIKRVNEAWSNMVGRPCVVHCSAGVGRTGTLVALDCLLDQLRAEGHAAVFNTVAELRRQRNFLVQSLKQYVFVYRALVEYSHYGDTEIPANRLKASIDRLRNTPPGAANCLMEIEFEKILNSPIPEPLKSCAAGAAEELRPKNRSQDILPYDRNRVILAPIPTRDYSTYINASFIEAYDNTEGFIITQDPLPSTIMDFWRMVSEHNVTTIVMLSELGEGKCPRYWDDGTAQYEHISVQYEESESCPYYTRRQFRVVNNKAAGGLCASVRQLQYQGWPTAAGAVPEVTRGLADLALAAAAPAPAAQPGAMLVHCQLGTERSSLFVALCILICQLRTERRVDVCCVARKMRSQRARTIDTFLHYEFLHRAILNYAELHNLLEDS